MTNFKVGDRVKVIARPDYASEDVVGLVGTIVNSQDGIGWDWEVDFDQNPEGLWGVYAANDQLELIDSEPTFMDAYYWLCDSNELEIAADLLEAFDKGPKITVELTRSEIEHLRDNTCIVPLFNKLTAALDAD